MLKSSPKAIGITLGDPAGIGAEIVAQSLAQPRIRRLASFWVIGDAYLFQRYFPKRYSNCAWIDAGHPVSEPWRPGRPDAATGSASLAYLNCAITLLKNKKLSGLVTAPVCKEAISQGLASFEGHTEFLADAFGSRNKVGMMFVSDSLRVLLATRHVPLQQVSSMITRDLVYNAIVQTHAALKNYFRLRKPTIGVCGLNPHAGERGRMGTEEIATIIPAIEKARQQRITVKGPLAADTLFYAQIARHFDAIIAMYHDQGLAPVKALYFRRLVNLTIGLPFVRTSPAHGTAFDIAGKNKADASSMTAAIKLAVQLRK